MNEKLQDLNKVAREVRKDIINMISVAGSGHPAGSLSMVEIFVSLYFSLMNHDPKDPDWAERDRLVISNGHTCPALYSVMARAGYFDQKLLKTYTRITSPLQGHPERLKLPGIETTSGPLGSGLAQAAGIALASRMDEKRFRVFCTTSDGEHDEGNHWEAVLFAAKYKLSNLTQIIDRNRIQIEAGTESTLPLDPLREKYVSFNWNVVEINGHDFSEIAGAVNQARAVSDKPTAIIANTIAGKGVSFMEGDYKWHAKAPNKEEAERALKELKY